MLTEIKLKNFKCFEDETIKLVPFNLFTGLNGMGKSTVIQALLLLRQSYYENFLNKLVLNGESVQIGNAKDLLFQYAKNREIAIGLQTNNGMDTQWILNADSKLDHLTIINQPNLANISLVSLFNNKFHFLTAGRLEPRAYYEISTHKVINENQIGIKGEFVFQYLEIYGKKDIPIKKLKHPQTNGLTLYEQVNAWLSEIRPGSRIGTRSNDDMSLISGFFQFSGGEFVSNNFRLPNVGFGLTYVLPIIVAILCSEPGTLLIIENPEAHLHPKGQAQIGSLLALAADNGIQVIIETHSDHVLNGARVAVKEGVLKPEDTNLLFFHAEKADDMIKHCVKPLNIDKDGRIDEWPLDFFDELDKQLLKLI
jgi:predicted ATPase